MAEKVAFAGGEIVTLPMASKSPFTIIANIGLIANLIERRGVDLVHARSRAPAWSAYLAARRTGKPFVTTYHGAYGEVGPFKAAYNSVMAKGDRVIANSRYTASVIEALRDLRHNTSGKSWGMLTGMILSSSTFPRQPVCSARMVCCFAGS